jgi:lipoprotein-anchoring transpeptidase ErfK/SrfK
MCVSSVFSPASASLLIRIDKSAQTLTVMRDGKHLHTWPVSTGTASYGTPSGAFTPFRMEAEHFSKEWDNAPMPHAVFFTRQGHAVHGTYHIRRLGTPASHGCVRLAPGNAARLFALVKREGLANTQVVVTGSERVALRRMKEKQAARQPNVAVRTETDSQPQFSSPQSYSPEDARPF